MSYIIFATSGFFVQALILASFLKLVQVILGYDISFLACFVLSIVYMIISVIFDLIKYGRLYLYGFMDKYQRQ